MNRLMKLGAATALVATLAGASAPAMARPHYYGGGYGGWGGYHHYHHGNGIGLPGLLIGGLIGGGIVAAASSANNGRRETYYEEAPPPPLPSPPVYRESYGGEFSSRDRAVELCSASVESRGGDARVENISGVYRSDGGWIVAGTASDRGRGYDGSRFTCTTRFGQVENLAFSG